MSDPVKPSQVVTRQYSTNNGAGSAANWSSDPTLELVRNGTVDVAVIVTHVAASTTGFPGFTFTVPSGYAAGDGLQVRASGSLDGQTPCGIVWVGHVITKRVSELNDAAAGPTAVAIRTELDSNSTKLVNLDATITSRMAAGAAVQLATSQPNYAPAKAGDEMTLTSGERTAVANEVETQIIDDTDSEKVLQAIVNKIAAANPSLGDLTLSAIAAAVRNAMATELGRIDAPITSRSTYDGSDTSGVATLLGRLTSTRAGNLDNLNSSVSDLATAVATIATVLDGIKGVGWTNETLKAIFEKDVEATIGEEQIAEISGEISAALADEGITVAEFAAEALAQLAATRSISLVSPFLPNGDLQIQIGDDYLAADGTALDWTNTAGSWGDLTGCDLEFRSSRVVDGEEVVNEVLPGIVVNPSGSTQKIRVEIPAAWSLTLSPTTYAFQIVRINVEGHERTLRRGNLVGLRRVGVAL